MIERFLEKLTDKLPVRRIDGFKDEPYLERAYLFSLFGFTAYIHRFVASDPDRGMHDHPWGLSFSFVLSGHYIEKYLHKDQIKHRKIKWFNWIPGYRFHRVMKPEGYKKPIWTFFVHGPRIKSWGFANMASTSEGTIIKDYNYLIYKGYSGKNKPGWHKTASKGVFVKRYRRDLVNNA